MSIYRTFWMLAHTPLVTSEAAKRAAQGVPLTTFREYSSTPSSSSFNSGRIRSLSTSSALAASENDHQTSPTGPDTDEIAHTDEAYEGGQSNPETSKKRIEGETGQSMDNSAADSRASSKPSEKGEHDVAGSKTVSGRKPGQKEK